MRYFYALSLLLALGLGRSAHAQQPFLKYGVIVKVATLSNGRFQEFFTNDSLRRIGSVVYDTRLRRVAYLLPPDSLVGHAKPDITSRWMSPDPLAEKYMYITPYAYGNNNPVRYMDHDGREIVDSKGNAVTINKSGGFAYAGKDASIITFVGALSKTDVGSGVLKSLVDVDTKVSINISNGRGRGVGMGGEVEGLTVPTLGKDGSPKTVIDKKTGKEVYESAKINIYMGTFDAEKNKPKATDTHGYTNGSAEEYVNAVGSHEGTHVTQDVEVNKATQQNCAGCNDDQLADKQSANREQAADKVGDASRQQYQQLKTNGQP